MTVYLVEDEPNIRDTVVYALKASGYEAEGFAEARAFYAAVEKSLPELVLLDIMLPGEDGLAILKKLRSNQKTYRLPIILLTAKTSEFDKVMGLDLGADDYVTKPFGMMELLARVKALLRRAVREEASGAAVLRAGAIEMRPEKRTLTVNDRPISLTLKEFDLLRLLLENPGIVFTRELILERVWDYDYEGDSRTVDVHVRTLRQKLGSAAEVLETVRGVGYRIGEKR
jgi:two-component system alkaline phosphatase synthesis response regulator PhoP